MIFCWSYTILAWQVLSCMFFLFLYIYSFSFYVRFNFVLCFYSIWCNWFLDKDSNCNNNWSIYQWAQCHPHPALKTQYETWLMHLQSYGRKQYRLNSELRERGTLIWKMEDIPPKCCNTSSLVTRLNFWRCHLTFLAFDNILFRGEVIVFPAFKSKPRWRGSILYRC